MAWCDKEQWKTEAYGKYQGKERQHQEDGKREAQLETGHKRQKLQINSKESNKMREYLKLHLQITKKRFDLDEWRNHENRIMGNKIRYKLEYKLKWYEERSYYPENI